MTRTTSSPIRPPTARLIMAGRADLGVAEHPEQLAEARQGLGEQGGDRLEGLVARADPGPAGQQDGVELARSRIRLEQRANPVGLVGDDLRCDDDDGRPPRAARRSGRPRCRSRRSGCRRWSRRRPGAIGGLRPGAVRRPGSSGSLRGCRLGLEDRPIEPVPDSSHCRRAGRGFTILDSRTAIRPGRWLGGSSSDARGSPRRLDGPAPGDRPARRPGDRRDRPDRRGRPDHASGGAGRSRGS